MQTISNFLFYECRLDVDVAQLNHAVMCLTDDACSRLTMNYDMSPKVAKLTTCRRVERSICLSSCSVSYVNDNFQKKYGLTKSVLI